MSTKKVEKIGWGKGGEAIEEEVVPETEKLDPALQAINVGLKIDEMKRIYKEEENKYPRLEVLPMIIKGISPDRTRFYVVRALAQSEVPKLNELFARLQDKEVEIFRAKLRDEYIKTLGKDVTEIPENKVAEYELLANARWFDEEHLTTVLNIINQIGLNMIAVCYPPNHKERIQADLVPPGDVDILAKASSSLSGWSQVRTDIAVYEKENPQPDPQMQALYETIMGAGAPAEEE